jgi:large subunit ribosomal protein L25
MLQVEMSAAVREVTGKGNMRRLRSEGQTPGVVYGAGVEALALKFETKALMASLLEIYRRNAVVTLKVDNGVEKSVVVKEVQTDPVTDTLIHADFCEIDLDKSSVFKVPLTFEGTAKGVDLGGFLNVATNSVSLKGKPLDIPNECVLDITELNIGDELKFSAISLPEGVELVSKADAVCVAVVKQ